MYLMLVKFFNDLDKFSKAKNTKRKTKEKKKTKTICMVKFENYNDLLEI